MGLKDGVHLNENHQSNYLGLTNQLTPIILAYGYCGQFANAVKVMNDYLINDPKEDRILQLLGLTELKLGNFSRSVECLQKSWDDGFVHTPLYLAMACIYSRNVPELEKLVPNLLQHKKEDVHIVEELAAYSIMTEPFSSNVFLQAIEGVSDEDLLKLSDSSLGPLLKCLWLVKQESRARAIIAEAAESNRDLIDGLLTSREWLKAVIDDYEKSSTRWKPKEILLAAIAYANEGQYDKAKSCYVEYLKVRPDEKRARRGLGMIYSAQKDLVQARAQFAKAWALGDVPSLFALGSVIASTGELDDLKPLIPDFLKHRSEDIQTVIPLIAYSVGKNPPDKKLFFQAIDGLSDEQILQHSTVTHDVIVGLRMFGEEERARLLQEKASKIKRI